MKRQGDVDAWRLREAENEAKNEEADALMEDSQIRFRLYQQYRREGLSYSEAKAKAARNLPFANGYQRSAAPPAGGGQRLGTTAPTPCLVCEHPISADPDAHVGACLELQGAVVAMGFAEGAVARALRRAWGACAAPTAERVAQELLEGESDHEQPTEPEAPAPVVAPRTAAGTVTPLERDLAGLGFPREEVRAAAKVTAHMMPPPSTEEVVDVILRLREQRGAHTDDDDDGGAELDSSDRPPKRQKTSR